MKTLSVVIPVYKNKQLFLRNLRKNYEFIKDDEVVVVDDASEEDIPEMLSKQYPKIQILTNEKNLGFAGTVNKGIQAAHGDIVVLLNTDVRLTSAFKSEVLKKFEQDEKLFAVSFAQKESEDKIVGKNKIQFQQGLPSHSRASDEKEGLNAWAEGGSCALNHTYLKQLGGFREIYAPFYWEDIDLSFRAYKAGWHVLFDPNIVVIHKHESTIGKYFEKGKVKRIAYRNQFFFTWTNLSGSSLLNHLLYLPLHIMRALLRRDGAFFIGLLSALLRIFAVINIRMNNSKLWRVNDNIIFDRLGG